MARSMRDLFRRFTSRPSTALALAGLVVGFLACRDASAPDDGSNPGAVPPRDSLVVTTPPRDSVVWSVESGGDQVGRLNSELPAEIVFRAMLVPSGTPAAGRLVRAEVQYSLATGGSGATRPVVTPDSASTDAGGRVRFRLRLGSSTTFNKLTLQGSRGTEVFVTIGVLPGPPVTARLARAPLPTLPQQVPVILPTDTLRLARADSDQVAMAAYDEFSNFVGPVPATWATSAASIVSVTANGQVLGLAPGRATVTGTTALGNSTWHVSVDSGAVPITRISATRYEHGISIGRRVVLVSATGALRLIDSTNSTDEQAPLNVVDLLVGAPDGTIAMLAFSSRRVAIRRPTGAWVVDSVPLPTAPEFAAFVGGDLVVWSGAPVPVTFCIAGGCDNNSRRARRAEAGGWSAIAVEIGRVWCAGSDASGNAFFSTSSGIFYSLMTWSPGSASPVNLIYSQYTGYNVLRGTAGGIAHALTALGTTNGFSVHALSPTGTSLVVSLPRLAGYPLIVAGSDSSVTWWDGTRVSQARRGVSVTRVAPAVLRFENWSNMPSGLIRLLTVGPDGALYASREGSGTYRVTGLRP
jgi:hypothetical protein